jgi:hypothetical protein
MIRMPWWLVLIVIGGVAIGVGSFLYLAVIWVFTDRFRNTGL